MKKQTADRVSNSVSAGRCFCSVRLQPSAQFLDSLAERVSLLETVPQSARSYDAFFANIMLLAHENGHAYKNILGLRSPLPSPGRHGSMV